jgi:hypothetical protein
MLCVCMAALAFAATAQAHAWREERGRGMTPVMPRPRREESAAFYSSAPAAPRFRPVSRTGSAFEQNAHAPGHCLVRRPPSWCPPRSLTVIGRGARSATNARRGADPDYGERLSVAVGVSHCGAGVHARGRHRRMSIRCQHRGSDAVARVDRGPRVGVLPWNRVSVLRRSRQCVASDSVRSRRGAQAGRLASEKAAAARVRTRHHHYSRFARLNEQVCSSIALAVVVALRTDGTCCSAARCDRRAVFGCTLDRIVVHAGGAAILALGTGVHCELGHDV